MSDDSTGQLATSRKWKLVLLIICLATIGSFIPPLISVWLFGAKSPLIILSGTEWVSVVTLGISAYFGANVWEKHVHNKHLENSSVAEYEEDEDEIEDDSNKEA